MKRLLAGSFLITFSILGIWLLPARDQKNTSGNEPAPSPAKIGHPSFLSPHFKPIILHRSHLFVANTPADTVDVFDTTSNKRRMCRSVPTCTTCAPPTQHRRALRGVAARHRRGNPQRRGRRPTRLQQRTNPRRPTRPVRQSSGAAAWTRIRRMAPRGPRW